MIGWRAQYNTLSKAGLEKGNRIYFPQAGYPVLGSALILWGLAGRYQTVSTLGVALIVVAAVLLVNLFRRRFSSWYIIDFWLIGFIYLFSGEYGSGRETITTDFGVGILAVTEGFIVSAFGASLLGYSWFLQPLLKRVARKTLEVRPERVIAPQETVPVELGVLLFAFISILLFYVFVLYSPGELFFSARSARLSRGSSTSVLNAVIVMLPVYCVYLITHFKKSQPIKVIAILCGTFSLLVVYASGTRFWFGFSVMGIIFYLGAGLTQLTRRRKIILAFMAAAVYLAQGAILDFRGAGGGLSSLDLTAMLEDRPTRISSEGTLNINAWIHKTEHMKPSNRVPENLFILYWWIPRAVWPNKPTMAGHWFIREMTTLRGYSAAHSASGGFSMPALLDFGPLVGIVFCLVYGGIIAVLESLASRYRYVDSPYSLMVGIFYFGTVFMVRSLHTSIIFMQIAFFAVVVPANIAYRVRAKARTRIMPTKASNDRRSRDKHFHS